MYGTTLRENHIFTDGIIGISHLELDIKRHKGINILHGNRNGHQMFGTINFGKRINSEKLNLNPNVKIDLGYTMLDEYREKNEYGTTSDVLFFKNHEILTGFGTVSLLMDDTIKHYEDKIINHTGRIEYIIDFSPSSDADFYYVSDPDTRYSLKINGEDEKSFRIGYGFDVTSISGWSVIANFERFQTKGSGYMNEIYLSAGYVPIDGTKFAFNLIDNNNIKAGFDLCTGDAAVQLDADGEDDPALILQFLKLWEEGNDVVYGIRKKRKELAALTFIRNVFYNFLNRFSEINLPEGAGDFRIIDRKVIDYLKKFDERNLYLRGLISHTGFKQTGFKYDRKKRLKGESKISIIKYLEIALSAITSFTKAPLFIIFFLGIIIFSISLILMIVYLILFLLGKIDQPGFTTIILIQLFFSGLIMFVVSIISIYVGYILDEVKKRPTYIIEDEEKK